VEGVLVHRADIHLTAAAWSTLALGMSAFTSRLLTVSTET